MAKDQKQDIELGITRLEYGDLSRPQRAVLTIQTDRHYNGGVASYATVFWFGGGERQHAFGLAGGGDYEKKVYLDQSVKSVTQKAIDRQHAEVFTPATIEQLTGLAKAHYAGYVAAGADGMHNVYLPAEVTHA